MKKYTCSSGKNYASGGRVEGSKPVKETLSANTAKPDFGKTDMSSGVGKERKGKC